MSIVTSSGTLVKRLLKEHIWSNEMKLWRKASTKLKESLTQNLENFLETRFKIEIRNLAKLYCVDWRSLT